jgi:hypothetical protein
MRNILRRWLLRRRKPALPPLVPLCWYEQRTREKIAEDYAKHPEMCEPDIGHKPRITARITQIIPRSETLVVPPILRYSDETMKVACRTVDRNATMPMNLVEI